MSTELLETGDMMVVTVRVPTTSAERLSVEVAGHLVTIVGPAGFRHAADDAGGRRPRPAPRGPLPGDPRAPGPRAKTGRRRTPQAVPVRTLAY